MGPTRAVHFDPLLPEDQAAALRIVAAHESSLFERCRLRDGERAIARWGWELPPAADATAGERSP